MITLYHATSLYNCEKILKSKMIIPQGSNGVGFIDSPNDFDETLSQFMGYIFLTDDFEIAHEYGDAFNKGYAIIELLLPEELLLPDNIDSPNSVTWKDSLKDIHQVKVKGNIHIDKIKKIHYIN